MGVAVVFLSVRVLGFRLQRLKNFCRVKGFSGKMKVDAVA